MSTNIGFSTGSIALGDFEKALEVLADQPVSSIELSALRLSEFQPMIDRLNELDLTKYNHVSIHAPSQIPQEDEEWVVRSLKQVLRKNWFVIIHPDSINTYSLWKDLGSCLLIENMDKRKPIGRTSRELTYIFSHLPEAGLCFDLAHARQVDPSMMESYLILKEHGSRMKQMHLSVINTKSRHQRLNQFAINDFYEICSAIPSNVPCILESPVRKDEIHDEIRYAVTMLSKCRWSRDNDRNEELPNQAL